MVASLLLALPAAGDELVLGMVLEPPHLDPTAGAAEAIDEVVYANLFEGLTRIRQDGSVAPALASAWQVSDDGRRYAFTLRKSVRFHDGTGFDAEDVAVTFQRLLGEDSVNAQKPLFQAIERVEVIAPDRVTLHLARPVGTMLFNLGLGDAVIVAPESADTNTARPIGTGPFAFTSWRRGDAVILDRFEDYWGAAPTLSRVTFRIIPDAGAAFAALKAGGVDGFANFPAPETVSLLDGDPDLTVARGATEGETLLAFNHRHPALGDLRVRRAIAHGLNKPALIEGAMFGEGAPIGSHFPPYRPEALDLSDRYPFDPERARALLAEAGYADGLRLRLALPPPAYARRGGEIIAAQLRAIGIRTEIEALEWAQWLGRVFTDHDFDLTVIAHTEPNDIAIYAREDYYFGWRDLAFDALIARLDREGPGPARTALLHEAQRRLADQAVNGFLFQLPKLGVWQADIEGLWYNAPIQANDVTGVRIRPR